MAVAQSRSVLSPLSMESAGRHRLVVVGSGWVGLYIAQYVDTSIYEVSVISPRRTSAYTPLLASAACGLLPFSCAEESIRVKGRRINFIKANALSVDNEAKQVRCEAAFDEDKAFVAKPFDVSYDTLVLAPGCKTNTFNTPGAGDYAMFMKHVSDAMALRKKLFDRLEQASLPNTTDKEASALLHVAIVGGGPTGVEVTAELSDLARRELKQLYPSVAHLLHITIFDVAEHILGVYDKKLYEYATSHLEGRGVRVATGCIIEKVEESWLHVKGQSPIPYGILLWVTGNKSVALVDGLSVKKTERGLVRVLTDDRLRVKRPSAAAGDDAGVFPDIFALGDAADIEGQSLPTTAEVAVQKSKYLVKHLNGYGGTSKPPVEPFAYVQRKLVTYIGGHDGIIEGSVADAKWSGQKAWLSWRSGSFTWTRTWRTWLDILLTMALNFFFGKNVMRL